MVGLREVSRTATFAWSPSVASHYLATGTKAGAVDEGFSNDTQLELWDLDLGNTSKGRELRPAARISTDSGFNDIAWTKDGSSSSHGIIAGALENGSLDLWNAEKLLSAKDDAFMSRTSKHSGSIKALQFNAFRPELLATVGAKGEFFISDLHNVANPFRMGNAVARADNLECLDWNKRTSHIMVTGSSGGTMTVWDIKNKRESLTLNNLGRKAVSAVAWDPAKTTRLITATPEATNLSSLLSKDNEPLILVWDLRNANAPERVLKGHDDGVLSLSWCHQDSDLLLSCGKDNRNICWNPQNGEPLGEFPVVTNWTFQTRWNPHDPTFMATSSFDGKIVVQSIQSTNSEIDSQSGSQGQIVDDEHFFNKAQTQPQGTVFSLKKAPKWLERPCGAVFGFGGKIVSFKSSTSEATKRSMVRISAYAIDDSIVSTADLFEAALANNDLDGICDTRITEVTSDVDKSDWKVIKTLISQNTRKGLVEYLGFSGPEDEATDGVSKLSVNGENGGKNEDIQSASKIEAPESKINRLSAYFDNNIDGDSFLSELAPTKSAKTNSPFRIYTGSEADSDQRVTRALLLGDFEKALDVCLQERRMSDAFMLAICGGQTCVEKAQKAYFGQKEGGPTYLRLLASVVGKNLWDVVHNADLESWKDVMVTLCTYADAGEFPDLCEALGDRLEEQMRVQGDGSDRRKDATFCYLAGSKLEKVVAIWISELQEMEISSLESAGRGSGFSIHARSLQSFIEKVTVFRRVTSYQDSQQDMDSNWKLAALYDKYIEYAEIASAHGQLQVAERYLDLLPSKYTSAAVAKNRIKNATRKAAPKSSSQQLPAASRVPERMFPRGSEIQQEQHSSRSTKASSSNRNPYAPASTSIAPSNNPYAPVNPQYAVTGHPSVGYPQLQLQQPPPQPGMTYNLQYQNGPLGGPPRTFNPSPSILPPSKAANMGNWNDMPESFFKPPSTSRRGTPGIPTNGTHQFLQPMSSPSQPIGPPPKSTPPIAPPPKAGTSAPRISSPPMNAPQSLQQIDQPSSTPNPYPPSQDSLPKQPQATIPRGPSPYDAPSSAPPPSNRYAPSQPASSSEREPPNMISSGRQAPLQANPYAPQQSYNTAQQGPPQQQHPPPLMAPPQRSAVPDTARPQGPQQGSRPSTAQAQRKSATSKHRKRLHLDGISMALADFLKHPEIAHISPAQPNQFLKS